MVMTWPIFGAWVSLFKRGWLWLGLSVIVVVFFVQEYFRSKQFLCLFIYFIIIETYLFFGNTYFKGQLDVLLSIFSLLITGAITHYFVKNLDTKYKMFFLRIFLLFLLIVSTSSFILNLSFPNVIRENFSYLVSGETSPFSFLERYGLSNYTLPHAVPVLIPGCVFHLVDRNNKLFKRFVYGALTIACVILAYVSGSTTAFLLAILVTIVSFLIRKGRVRDNAVVCSFWGGITLLMMNDEVVLSLVHLIDGSFGTSNGGLHDRLMEIESSIVYGATEGDLDSRANLYMSSIDSFSENVLFGGGKVGGHSVILDHLGTYGLFGFIPYVLFIYYQIKNTMKYIQPNVRIYYYVSAFAGLAMLVSKNTSNWYMWCFMFVMSPLLLSYNSKVKQ